MFLTYKTKKQAEIVIVVKYHVWLSWQLLQGRKNMGPKNLYLLSSLFPLRKRLEYNKTKWKLTLLFGEIKLHLFNKLPFMKLMIK